MGIYFMKLFLDYTVITHGWGGINSFFKNFFSECSSSYVNTITLVKDYHTADVILFGANTRGEREQISIKDVAKYGRSKAIVVHRMDGLRKGFDDFVKSTMGYVDGYVFQSENCKEDYSFIKNKSTIICNGVNGGIFVPRQDLWNRDTKLKFLMSSWSTSVDKGFREFAHLSSFEDIECSFVGRWNSTVTPNNVRFLPAVPNDMLPSIYRKYDVLVFPSRRDACSNVVLEALASGLPVIYYKNSGVDDIVGTKYGVGVESFVHDYCIDKIHDNYEFYVDNIKKDIDSFSMKHVVAKYIKFFDELKLK